MKPSIEAAAMLSPADAHVAETSILTGRHLTDPRAIAGPRTSESPAPERSTAGSTFGQMVLWNFGFKLAMVFLLGMFAFVVPLTVTSLPIDASAQAQVEASAAAVCPKAKHRTLRQGNTGKSVKHAQCLLNFYWGNNLKVDGIFGRKTKAAVKVAQRNWGMTVDGIVGRCTWPALHANIPPDDCID